MIGTMPRWVIHIALGLAAHAASLAAAQTAAPGEFAVSGAGQHLWVIRETASAGRTIQLSHHATTLGGPFYRPMLPLSERPDRLTSWGSRAWLLYLQTEPTGRTVRRDVYSIEAKLIEATLSYQPIPPDYLKTETPLPGEGVLADLIGTPRGLIALLVPEQRAGAAVQGRPGSLAAQPVLDRTTLLRLDGAAWTDLELPEDLIVDADSRLSTVGEDGQGVAIISPAIRPGELSHIHIRPGNGSWRTSTLDLGPHRLIAAAPTAGQIALVQEDRESGDWLVSYVRDGTLLRIAAIDDPGRHHALTSLDGRLIHLQMKAVGTLSMQRMDPLTGELSGWIDMRLQPLAPRAIVQTIIVTSLIVVVLFLALTVRPAPATPVRLPARVAALPLGIRLLAFLVDLGPGALLAMIALHCRPIDLLHHPLLGGAPDRMIPFAAMVVTTMLHSVAGELVRATTIGKTLFGARIANLDGGPPTMRQILTRNLFKLAIIVIPPIAVLMLRSPHGRGLAEIKSGTVIVHEVDEPAAS